MTTEEAAQLLGITPHQLTVWSSRLGHPSWRTTDDGHRIYDHAEVLALRRALDQSSSISAAMATAYADPHGGRSQ